MGFIVKETASDIYSAFDNSSTSATEELSPRRFAPAFIMDFAFSRLLIPPLALTKELLTLFS